MKSNFQFHQYASDNPDLASSFGQDDDVSLTDHFFRHGVREMRGINPEDYMRLEAVICSQKGHIYLAGWADRRIIQDFHVSIEIGYMRYDFDEIDICWYHRPDVSVVTGDDLSANGFLAMCQIPEPVLHARMLVYINNRPVYHTGQARFSSVDRFLQQALAACAVLADKPVGTSLGHAQTLLEPFRNLWQDVLRQMTFTCAFQHRGNDPVERSIIITIYRKADMLLMQLQALAQFLSTTETEVVVVGNDLQGTGLLVEQLKAFSQIHDIRLSLHVCSGNSGFSAGNNHGAQVARGDVLIFMNPDVFPPAHEPQQAFAFLEGDPGEALHGALLYYGDGLLMHSGMYTTGDLVFDERTGESHTVLRVEHFGKGLSHHIEDAALDGVMDACAGQPVLVSAALWKIRKSTFFALGGLPTDYIFAYYEDADFCLKALAAGHAVVVDETSRWIHMEGVGKATPPAVRSFMWLNRALYSRRFADSPFVVGVTEDLSLL